MNTQDLVGIWELVSCDCKSTDADSFLPYGTQPIGKLIYDQSGHMSVILMSNNRKAFASEDLSKATLDEMAAAFISFDAYSGRWSLDVEKKRVVHHIEVGRVPNWIGEDHYRFVDLNDKMLSLNTDEFQLAGKSWKVYASWRRVNN